MRRIGPRRLVAFPAGALLTGCIVLELVLRYVAHETSYGARTS